MLFSILFKQISNQGRVPISLKNEKHITLSDLMANLEIHHKALSPGWCQTDDISFLVDRLK